MSNPDVSMKDLVEFIAKALVDEVGRIEISEITGNQTNIIELKVAKEDIGKVIGRNGRTARALRTVISAIAGRSVRVDLIEADEAR